ncbi:MAG: YggS family pyridoxal phosphate-dependent enzyme [Lachnospiraceae bacterium]|nr:YggS family pyridoxal phosphate-dependent enzyme [Lachnospiraceae bacterium]
MITENIKEVEKKIEAACARVGRSKDEVCLIAVSKTKPVEYIEEAYQTGTRDFGENKVQEICDKYEVLPKDIKWHMIGHLQRNKVKYIVDKVCLIHSVDSYRLAEQINQECIKKNCEADILIQVNMAHEDTKFGIDENNAEEIIREIAKLEHVHIKGLMTIAPYVSNPEENRVHFANMKKLYVDIKHKNIDNVIMSVLSMGMTNDYEVAIEEGATHVRVGTGIFGERDYTKK